MLSKCGVLWWFTAASELALPAEQEKILLTRSYPLKMLIRQILHTGLQSLGPYLYMY